MIFSSRRNKYPNLGFIFDCLIYICEMRVIAFRFLREFFEKPEYADSEASLKSWYYDVKSAAWKNSNELKEQFKSASIVGNGRAVFNIKGNEYRLITAIDYEFQVIFIRFIGTHKQYDKIDAKII
jgi:mRNA interferase HigB